MAALGLALGQIGLGTNVYGILTKPVEHRRARQRIVHEVASSAAHPTLELGGLPVAITAALEVDAAGLVAFLADVEAATSRRFSFVLPGGVEAYYMVKGGDVDNYAVVNPLEASGQVVEVEVRFVAGDQRLYRAADGAVLLGA